MSVDTVMSEVTNSILLVHDKCSENYITALNLLTPMQLRYEMWTQNTANNSASTAATYNLMHFAHK